jgi:DNA-directed RNA polymerase subunit K/omega
MTLKPLDLDKVTSQTSNLYEVVAAVSRRARQINEDMREEIEEKIAPFKARSTNPATEEDADKIIQEQVDISIKYEKMAKPTLRAIEELQEKKYDFKYREPRKEVPVVVPAAPAKK